MLESFSKYITGNYENFRNGPGLVWRVRLQRNFAVMHSRQTRILNGFGLERVNYVCLP